MQVQHCISENLARIEEIALNEIKSSINTKIELLENQLPLLAVITEECLRCLKAGGKILFCGNGGSCSDSQHLAAELVGRYKSNRQSLGALALSADTSVLTCISNDFGYEHIFSRQIEALAKKGDVIVAISTSGNSQNIIMALKAARKLGLVTIALLGKDGGRAKGLATHQIIVSSENTARVQEAHIMLGHIICEVIESTFGDD